MHTKRQAHAFKLHKENSRLQQESFSAGEAQTKTWNNKERYATLATQTVPRTYVWHNRLTTDFVERIFPNFHLEALLSAMLVAPERSCQETERKNLATDVQQLTLFFNKWNHSQFSFLLADRARDRCEATQLQKW